MDKNAPLLSGSQADIFQQITDNDHSDLCADGADLDANTDLKAALVTAVKLLRRQGRSRQHILDEMNRLLPDLRPKLTLRRLNSWTANSNEDRDMPARFVPAFCAATGCDLPLRVLASTIRMDISDQRERLTKEYGQTLIDQATLARHAKLLKSQLK